MEEEEFWEEEEEPWESRKGRRWSYLSGSILL